MRYFVDGIEVTRRIAVTAWHESDTYRQGRRVGGFFARAEAGMFSEAIHTHLVEAGIRITDDDGVSIGADFGSELAVER